jgi:hypothetical protein
MSYIDIRFHFDEIAEPDFTYYDLKSAQRIDTDIPPEAMLSIGETLGQSDRWNTGGPGVTLDAMTDNNPGPHEIEDYL